MAQPFLGQWNLYLEFIIFPFFNHNCRSKYSQCSKNLLCIFSEEFWSHSRRLLELCCWEGPGFWNRSHRKDPRLSTGDSMCRKYAGGSHQQTGVLELHFCCRGEKTVSPWLCCLRAGPTHLWHWVTSPHYAGPQGHCQPYRSSFQNVSWSERGWRMLLLPRELSCSPRRHPHDKTGTGSGESLSGPHSEALPCPPPQPGPWKPWGWGQDETLELKEER